MADGGGETGAVPATDRLRGYVELLRPGNAVAAGALTGIGAYVAGNLAAAPVSAGAAIAATVLATGAGNAINDYFDREIDEINDPDRPIPRGVVRPRGALGYSLVLFALAVVLALTLPVLAIAIAAINLIALVAYTELFKGVPGLGNAVVAYLGGSTFLFGAAAVEHLGPASITLFALAALSTFTREVVKDVEDVAGDREEGLDTLPLVVGPDRAIWIGAAGLVVAVLASPVPYLRGTFGWPYLAVVLPADAGMLYAAVRARTEPAAAQSRLKQAMFLAAVAFVVGRWSLGLSVASAGYSVAASSRHLQATGSTRHDVE